MPGLSVNVWLVTFWGVGTVLSMQRKVKERHALFSLFFFKTRKRKCKCEMALPAICKPKLSMQMGSAMESCKMNTSKKKRTFSSLWNFVLCTKKPTSFLGKEMLEICLENFSCWLPNANVVLSHGRCFGSKILLVQNPQGSKRGEFCQEQTFSYQNKELQCFAKLFTHSFFMKVV